VLLDFSIPPWFLDGLRKLTKGRDVPADFVVLRPSEEVCAARAAARCEGQITDYESHKKLYASFDEAPEFIIQTDEGDPRVIAELIREELKTGRFRL
jgi:hypothetical protein